MLATYISRENSILLTFRVKHFYSFFFRWEIWLMVQFEVCCPTLPIRSVMDEAHRVIQWCVPCVTTIDVTHVTMHSSMLLYCKAISIWFCWSMVYAFVQIIIVAIAAFLKNMLLFYRFTGIKDLIQNQRFATDMAFWMSIVLYSLMHLF